MPPKKKKETEVERNHGHCADVLMDDYGIPRSMRVEVCKKIDGVWVQITLIHDYIIASVRGWHPNPATRDLKSFLSQHQTHPPKHHKPL